MVILIVGPNKVRYQIHKDYICYYYYSPVTSAALNNARFPEGKTQTWVLDDVSEGCFRFLFQRIYSQKWDPAQLREGYVAENDRYTGLVAYLSTSYSLCCTPRDFASTVFFLKKTGHRIS